jgi:transposase
VICLDEMGPERGTSFPGARLVRGDPSGPRRERAKQQIDYGHRGYGYIFGAFVPATGAALTAPADRRSAANWIAFLDRVADWLDPAPARIYAVVDNLPAHRAVDVLLWALAHPHWEFVFQPTQAAYLNLIEPWWKIVRSLALKGRRFTSWDALWQAVEAATRYWNAHRHPFVWGRRKHRRAVRSAGIASLPTPA